MSEVVALNYSLYDCFAEEPFQGHVAAVVEVSKKLESNLAVKIASELCQTVTCFVWEENGQILVESLTKDGSIWSINHGLLGVAKHCSKNQDKYILRTASDIFEVKVMGDIVSIPISKQYLELTEMPERLNQAFDIIPVSVREIGKTCVVELRTVEEIINLDPDFSRIAKLDYDRVVLTAEGNADSFDYVYRYFSPKHYINENNGSLYVQVFLPLFWSERLKKDNFSFLQLSYRKAVGRVFINEQFIQVEAPVRKVFEGVLRVL